ncbi:MAG TPA: toxin-antitoxin system YwqK family antitoxin [Spirochaetota bacterium]|nr:toxin-antitoxin system YwqK family antitoxin [Spirochaetota bacterium]
MQISANRFLQVTAAALTAFILILIAACGIPKNGPVVIEYDNGKIKAQGTNKNGMKTGLWIENYTNGNLKSKGRYVITNGESRKHGEWKLYYQRQNKLKTIAHYQYGALEGYYTAFHTNGMTNYHIPYKNNKKEGEAVSFYPTGEINKKGSFKNNQKHGLWLLHYRNGQVKARINYQNGVQTGEYVAFHPNGEKYEAGGYSAEGEKDGNWLIRDENGNVKAQGKWQKGTREGKWTFKDKGKMAGVIPFKKGKTNGFTVLYDDEGNLKEKATYVDNSRTGEVKTYHPNGKLRSIGKYNPISKSSRERMANPKYDEKTGIWKYYDKQGNLVREGPYQHGQAHGTFKLYYPGKKLKCKGPYKHGARKGLFTFYNRQGTITKKLTYSGPSFRGKMIIYKNGKPKFEFNVGIPVLEEENLMKTGRPNIENCSGNFIEYYDNSTIKKVEGFYKKMMGKHGTWKYYDKKGNLQREENWQMGDKSGTWTYYKNGQPVKTEKYRMGDLVDDSGF